MSAIEGSGAQAGSFSLAAAEAGGPQLRTTYLSPELFEAAAMEAVGKDLMEMRRWRSSRKSWRCAAS
eukprot:2043928-Prymnesium_polylepis.1